MLFLALLKYYTCPRVGNNTNAQTHKLIILVSKFLSTFVDWIHNYPPVLPESMVRSAHESGMIHLYTCF